ncbi:MAG TPA: invasion associated locus B family protein, partial [Beijerinckiaceae bacterium]|nr:invasion associated locus B family protein [Beijerinckiaceae bacterium]
MSFATRLAHSRGSIAVAAAIGIGLVAPAIAQQPAQQQQPRPAQQRPAQPAQPATGQRPAAPQPAQPAPQAQQQQQPAGPTVVQVKPEPSQTDWTKVCGKDQAAGFEICYTTRDFVSDQGQPVLAVAIYDAKGPQGQKIVRFLMPLGLLLQPGIRFAVDQGQATPGKYAICFPNGCFAEAGGLKDDLINAMKKGTVLNVSVQNQAQREVTFAVPLAGFGKAFDGPPIDPKVLQEQQQKLQEEMQKRSEEMRRRLEQSGGGGAPGAPGAPSLTG